MKFFEGFRQRENEKFRVNQEEIEKSLSNVQTLTAEGESDLRELSYTRKLNAESLPDMEEKIRLAIRRDTIKILLDAAREHLARSTKRHVIRIELEAALAKLAELKGQPPPPPSEGVAQSETASSEEVQELESRFADIERQLSEVNARISAREQRLREQLGLSNGSS